MGLSRWRLTWRDDFDRVVLSMSKPELEVLRRSGVSSISGRRAFVSASDRLHLDVVHSVYLMEQAGLGSPNDPK
jgi:hypothetical protein